MKVRTGFVSNSSSSSFVVPRDCLTDEQVSFILALDEVPLGIYSDTWDIRYDGKNIHGYTNMENCVDDGLKTMLESNSFPMDKFEWENN